MTGTPLLLGIDGGGTKTVALLADQDGRVLGRGLAGPSNYHLVGVDGACAALGEAARAAFAAARLAPCPVEATCLGLAGADKLRDQPAFRNRVAQLLSAAAVTIVIDAELVLAAGTPEGWGVAVISGTGSIVFGRDRDGHVTRAGGWGYLLGDEGSAHAIGLAALHAVTRSADGCGPQTMLTSGILHRLRLSQPGDLVGRVYEPGLTTPEIADLTIVVEAAARQGDEVAQGLMRAAGRGLADCVHAVVRRLQLGGPIPCALAGSVLTKGECLAAAFLEAAAALRLRLDPIRSVAEPAEGAVRLARDLLA